VSARVALVGSAGDPRATTAAYLKNAGFDVHVYVELAVPTAFDGLVLLRDSDGDAIAPQVRSWMKTARSLRVVVVTSKPFELRDVATMFGSRLAVLAAPVFGWEVVDALRGRPAVGPQGA
jgi:hypothetical protein